MVVIKKFFKEETCKEEAKLWKELYDVNVRTVKLVQTSSTVMPFAFYCVRSNDKGIHFDFDLASWGKEDRAVVTENNALFDLWTAKVTKYMNTTGSHLTPVVVMEAAIKLLNDKGYVHRDLEWRHVALLPIVSDQQEIVDMKAIFIDLASVVKIDSTVALDKKHQRIRSIRYSHLMKEVVS